MRDFESKHILITGGSAGIGLGMAREFARRGADLSLIARNEARLEAAARELNGQGGWNITYPFDVTDFGELERMVDRVADAHGWLDGVVANAGYCEPGLFEELEGEALRRQIDTNYTAALLTVRYALPHLRRKGGGFVALVSSPAAYLPIPGFGAYGPTKAALAQLAAILRLEAKPHGVSVHLLLPPDTDTPGYRRECEAYPEVTRAVLASSKCLSVEAVAKVLVDGIVEEEPVITVGAQARRALWVQRYAPWLWEWYVERQQRHAGK